MKFEIRKIYALSLGDTWKEIGTCHVGEFKTNTTDHKRAFLYALHKLGIVCKRGKMAVVCDGNIYTLQDRRTGKPLFTAVPY